MKGLALMATGSVESRRFSALLTRAIVLCIAILNVTSFASAHKASADETPRRWLYVATPGIRDYLEYGGHGVLVFDIDRGHAFVRRIPTGGVNEKGRPLNVKGICASAVTDRLYVSTIKQLMCLDLVSEQLVWERKYDAGCDRMSITPDGKTIYLPTLEGPYWYVVDAESGRVLRKLTTDSGAHNTIVGLSGKFAYLAGLKSPLLRRVDTTTDAITTIGPFSASIRPFTVNADETRCYVNVNELLGFEVGDMTTGQKLYRVAVTGFERGRVKRHGCPSHGIGLTPDETQLWLTDGANSRMHVFDLTSTPPRQVASVELRDQPGWVTFSLDGKYAYPSTGDIVDVATRKVVAHLADEQQNPVQSEKMIEIHTQGGRPVRVGDQFGLGRAAAAK
jgi:hypothetical protein